MWKRLHSNRDPKDTLYSELHREFGVYFRAAAQGVLVILSKKPQWVLGIMILVLTASVVLSFTMFRQHKESHPSSASVTEVSAGFHQLMKTTGRLRETLRLKKRIDSLSANPHLSGTDSAILGQALDSLAILQQSLIHPRHEH